MVEQADKSLADQLARLDALDSCAVSDAMDCLGLTGTVDGLSGRTRTKKITGRVRTVKLGLPGDGHPTGVHLGAGTIADSSDTDVIVVEQRTGRVAAGWGGVLSNAAREKGIRGVIVEGPARDVDECDDIGFPVFSRSTTARTARGRVVEVGRDVPVLVGEVEVHPGDLVIADGSGAVFVAAARADEVLDAAERIAAREALMTSDVRSGRPVTEVMGASYESMLDAESDEG